MIADPLTDARSAARDVWLSDVLALLTPGDSVLNLFGGAPEVTTALAARAGWVTTYEPDPDRLFQLHERVQVTGWPNVTLQPAAVGAAEPHDVVIAAASPGEPHALRRLRALARRRVILVDARTGRVVRSIAAE